MDEKTREYMQEERAKQVGLSTYKPIQAKVIDVYDEETASPDVEPFSYKYEYTNPDTGLLEEAYDDNDVIETGELMYSIGDEIEVMYLERKPRPGDPRTSIVRRTPVFPELVKNKRKKAKLIKFIIFVIIFWASIYYCAHDSAKNNLPESQLQDTTIEQQTDQEP